MTDRAPEITIYTDGGCRPNPGPGGWGAVLIRPDGSVRELAGGEPETTNNRMELTAAREALRALDRDHRVRLYTDSSYLRKGITEWLPRWREGGWKTSQRSEVKNQDLWRALSEELERHQVTWHWVKGHSGDRWNERADRLASEAIPRTELPVVDPQAVHLFTAVSYSGAKGVGGWAALLVYGQREKLLSGRTTDGSANQLHLEAALAGLGELRRRSRVHVYTTSDYLRDGATAWLEGWRRRGWKTREGKPVAHRDLWRRLGTLLERHRVLFHVADRERRPEEMERAKEASRDAAEHGGARHPSAGDD